MKTIVTSLIFLASGSGTATTAFTPSNPSAITTTLSSSRYNDDYYRDYSNSANYNNNNNNRNSNNNRYDNYVTDRNYNSGRFDNSVGSASYGATSYGGAGNRQFDSRGNNAGRGQYGSSSQYRTYDSYNSNDNYRGGGSIAGGGDYYNRPYDRIGSSENFRTTTSTRRPNSRKMGGGGMTYYDDYDNTNYYNQNNYVVQQRRGGYADDIGGRSRYSTPMYSNGGYAAPQGLSEDFRTGREGPMSSMTSRQRQSRNMQNSNRIQDYYTPGERELMSQRNGAGQNNGLRYGWQQQYNRERGNVRMGSGEDFRKGSSLSRISDYFTPLERERRQMSDNRALGRGRTEGYGNDGGGYGQYGNSDRGGGVGAARRGGYYDDYPDYGFDDNYEDEYDDYFENDGGYSSGSRIRARNGSTWDNLLNMFRN
mmetsp:Transcript_7879/g.12200  ORF Transcript_7879/g.12200 Transcript_7879/m.12200 type:complete len:423 (-) Transcript_7879:161-1429(-)